MQWPSLWMILCCLPVAGTILSRDGMYIPHSGQEWHASLLFAFHCETKSPSHTKRQEKGKSWRGSHFSETSLYCGRGSGTFFGQLAVFALHWWLQSFHYCSTHSIFSLCFVVGSYRFLSRMRWLREHWTISQIWILELLISSHRMLLSNHFPCAPQFLYI
jgi:hypothetical protein